MLKLKKKATDSEQGWAEVRATLRRCTAARPDGPIRVKADRLTSEQRATLIGLVREGWADGSFDVTRLGGDRGEFEQLVEQAAGLEAGTFRRERQQDRAHGELVRLGREMNKPGRRQRFEQPGAVVLPRGVIELWQGEDDDRPVLWADDIAVLCYLLACWENGGALGNRAAAVVEEEGVVVVDSRVGLVPGDMDANGALDSWRRAIENMSRKDVGLLTVEKRGPTWRIRRGPALTAMYEQRDRESRSR